MFIILTKCVFEQSNTPHEVTDQWLTFRKHIHYRKNVLQ